ncbi:hypothetical protein Hanom_Chr16g01445641 [Helianthus anomalus]
MRCKNHSTDLSSITGVCATCLRERLFTIILTQEQSQPQEIDLNRCNSNSKNPTVNRSVSPYISHRKSVNNPVAVTQRPYNKPRLSHSVSDRRVYSSPQIAVTTGGCIGSSSSNSKKPNFVRFPSISNLFRSSSRNGNRNGDRNENCNRYGDADLRPRVSVSSCNGLSGGGGRPSSVTPSPSWWRGRQSSVTASNGGVPKQRCVSDRGMSPVRTDDDVSDGSSANESAESCKQTPMKTQARRGGGQKRVTELIFCPLVSASPHRMLSVKGKPLVDCGYSGDARTPVVPHISHAKSFSGNRSRKLVDFGRGDLNR